MYKDEATLLKHTMQWLEAQRRNNIYALRINDRYAKGYSDIFVCVKGIFVVIELKDDTGTASPHQKLFLKEIIKAGGIGGICRTIDEVTELIGQAVLKSGEHDS